MNNRFVSLMIERLREVDTLETLDVKFDADRARPNHNLAWTVERFAQDIFFARKMDQFVRPLLESLDAGMDMDEWVAMVENTRDDAIGMLVDGHWRASSTSMMQNFINQCESEAAAWFVDTVDRYLGRG